MKSKEECIKILNDLPFVKNSGIGPPDLEDPIGWWHDAINKFINLPSDYGIKPHVVRIGFREICDAYRVEYDEIIRIIHTLY